MDILTIDELKETIQAFTRNQFSDSQLESYGENSIVALEDNYHKSSCVLKVYGDTTIDFQLNWSKVFGRAGYKEPKKFTEKGAEAISFLLCHKLTDFGILEEAMIGTGIDYWLAYETNHANYSKNSLMDARLEISGILKETSQNTMVSRIQVKKLQTHRSNNTSLPDYVSIIEFSIPKAYFGKK